MAIKRLKKFWARIVDFLKGLFQFSELDSLPQGPDTKEKRESFFRWLIKIEKIPEGHYSDQVGEGKNKPTSSVFGVQHTKHIWRMAIILITGIITAVIIRNLLIPATFGREGHFRYESIMEYMSLPVIYAGNQFCMGCHSGESEDKEKGRHQSLSCEICHGPALRHISSGEKIADMPIERNYQLCARCHQKLLARPRDFPQVDLREHLIEQGIPIGEKIPPSICLTCHDPHDPLQESSEPIGGQDEK
jgi:hypothetical protein